MKLVTSFFLFVASSLCASEKQPLKQGDSPLHGSFESVIIHEEPVDNSLCAQVSKMLKKCVNVCCCVKESSQE